MPRFFNTAGVCEPRKHYMLPPAGRLPGLGSLIDQEAYFVVHAPRQSGKSTCFHHLARELTAGARYAAQLASCETARTVGDDVDLGIDVILQAIETEAGRDLPQELRPPPAESVGHIKPQMRLNVYLGSWCEQCPRPVVLFLDEIDALSGKTLLAVLQQLRAGYRNRPEGFPHAMALIGLRDVRDSKVREAPEVADPVIRELKQILGTSSPFNIKVESLTLRNFTEEELTELYSQHTAETGQVFSAEALQMAHGLTRGQPWLVNALARQVVTVEAPDPTTKVATEHVERAKEALILRRDTHIDSLAKRLREARVRQVIEPILAGELPEKGVPEDDVAFVEDLGLVALGPSGYGMANPIYREVVPRALTSLTERFLPIAERSFILPNGGLDFDGLLDAFVDILA